MAIDVQKYISHCNTCKMSKAFNQCTKPPMGKEIISYRPWQRLFIDFLGPYPRSKRGNTQLLIVLDHFSRFVLFKAVRQATADSVVNYLQFVFNHFSVPETIVSDNRKHFESKILKLLLEKYGVTHMFTPKYSPQANCSERTNRSLLQNIRSYLSSCHQEWDKHLDEISGALRNSSPLDIPLISLFLVNT